MVATKYTASAFVGQRYMLYSDFRYILYTFPTSCCAYSKLKNVAHDTIERVNRHLNHNGMGQRSKD